MAIKKQILILRQKYFLRGMNQDLMTPYWSGLNGLIVRRFSVTAGKTSGVPWSLFSWRLLCGLLISVLLKISVLLIF